MAISDAKQSSGIFGWIERTGNKLPDPVFLFFYLILFVIALSVVAEFFGWSAVHPIEVNAETGSNTVIGAASLLSAENIQRLWIEMPKTFTHFHPLGYVLVVMLGAGVAERSGLFATAMRAGVRNAPVAILTPIVALVAMLGNLAADAAYVVLIPLAGIIFAAAGRHPIAGIAAAFAGVSGGFSANLFPGQLDALLFGITQAAAETVFPGWEANIAGNWYFIVVMTFVFLPVIWFVTDRIIEPRLGTYSGALNPSENISGDVQPVQEDMQDKALTVDEKRGLRFAGIALLAVVALWLLMLFGPGTALVDESAAPEAQLTPFYQSLVAGFFLLFLLAGWGFGKGVGNIKNHRDLVKMMSDSMADMAYFLVLAFMVAHFVAMFSWSNLGLITAVHGAVALQSLDMPAPVLLALVVIFVAVMNLFVGSASAKWALLAPILVPMLMLIGVSAETTTAAYRVGDSATNIITPLMVYFPLILIFCQRWNKDFGIGNLTAMMLPYAIWLLGTGLLLIMIWVGLDIPLGPNSPVFSPPPTGN
ncbi:AbgT family transporter [Parasphingorhabdus sp.]|uniref:AbgT family transporter n=1 Tax=Parasphingorhabdus sp. TaxID=2709688 RepID=UPI003593C1B4